MKKKILVVEDDKALARILVDNLSFDGFDVDCAGDVNDARLKLPRFSPDLVVLDITSPDESGFQLFPFIRQNGRIPIVILSARGGKADKLHGLNLGADDYITKPFDLDELLARVHAVMRRARPEDEVLALGGVTIDFQHRRITRGARVLHLTHREFELLRYLAERRDRVVPREELLREVWGYRDLPQTRSVDHAIARLRKKIELKPHHPRFLHTVHGDGYCLTPRPATDTSRI